MRNKIIFNNLNKTIMKLLFQGLFIAMLFITTFSCGKKSRTQNFKGTYTISKICDACDLGMNLNKTSVFEKNVIYSGNDLDSTIYISTNFGTNWLKYNTKNFIIGGVLAHKKYFYYNDWNYIYRSTDGISFEKLEINKNESIRIGSLGVMKSNGEAIIVCLTFPKQGFIISTDDGITWKRKDEGLPLDKFDSHFLDNAERFYDFFVKDNAFVVCDPKSDFAYNLSGIYDRWEQIKKEASLIYDSLYIKFPSLDKIEISFDYGNSFTSFKGEKHPFYKQSDFTCPTGSYYKRVIFYGQEILIFEAWQDYSSGLPVTNKSKIYKFNLE